MTKNLSQWLAHCEALHPVVIDMGLARVKQMATQMQLRFDCPVITVAGTNGKGSTCAMLESILSQSGYRTGLYTSPHLVHFEERCRLQQVPVSPDDLCLHFEMVERARLSFTSALSLSYFEFTTLAILSCLQHAQLDVVILEVGLGGRLDAVNVIDTDCAVITSIDIDHTALLGNTREVIGFEKAGIMRQGKPVIVSDPLPPKSISNHAKAIGADIWLLGSDYHLGGDKQQWSWAAAALRGGRQYSGLAYPALRGANQLVNAAGVLAALTALRDVLPVNAQAIRNGLAFVELLGRFQIIPGTPSLVLDVAHNPHSVAALSANLDAMGFYPRTHAVLGAMADKDIETMLSRIATLVDAWYLCDLPTPRAAANQALQAVIEKLIVSRTDSKAQKNQPISLHSTPSTALQAAFDTADAADRIIVFGSFFTVGGVLAQGLPKRAPPQNASP